MLALAIQNLSPESKYQGSCTANTEEAYNNLVWDDTPKPSWTDIDDEMERLDVIENTESTRQAEIEAEQKSTGLKKITVEKAHQKIDQIFEGSTTVTLLRSACIKAFKLIVVFILK